MLEWGKGGGARVQGVVVMVVASEVVGVGDIEAVREEREGWWKEKGFGRQGLWLGW